MTDDCPQLLFRPEVEGKSQNWIVPSFYKSLDIHNKILQNEMLESGASHNFMLRTFMEKLGLDITKPYQDFYTFSSSKVRCLGLIKYLCISLVQIPTKSLVINIVITNIPPMYGMLLSISWGAKL